MCLSYAAANRALARRAHLSQHRTVAVRVDSPRFHICIFTRCGLSTRVIRTTIMEEPGSMSSNKLTDLSTCGWPGFCTVGRKQAWKGSGRNQRRGRTGKSPDHAAENLPNLSPNSRADCLPRCSADSSPDYSSSDCPDNPPSSRLNCGPGKPPGCSPDSRANGLPGGLPDGSRGSSPDSLPDSSENCLPDGSQGSSLHTPPNSRRDGIG